MKQKALILIGLCFTLSVGIVLILVTMSDHMKHQSGSFLRLFPSHPIFEGTSIDLTYNSYYLAGGTSEYIYLANHTTPIYLLELDWSLSDSSQIHLNIEGIKDQKFWSVRIQVAPPHFYLMDGAVPIVFQGEIGKWKGKRNTVVNEYFQDIVPISRNSFGVRSLSSTTHENQLGKIKTDSPYYVPKTDLIQKQIDGVFCTDGMLHYNSYLQQLIYLYRYRNEFLVMDSSLNLHYRGHTIDTTTQAKINVAFLGNSGATTLASPPLIVNNKSIVYKNWLFVNSNLLASNEHPDALGEAAVIDVYDLLTGLYRFSFYLFHHGGTEPLKEFNIYGNRLVALFETHLQLFDLNPSFFTE